MSEIEHRYIETLCEECLIKVSSYPDDRDPRGSYVDIELISRRGQWEVGRLRNRVRNAWLTLRNRYDWSGFQLLTRDEAERFRAAFDEAATATWPESRA